MRRVQYYDSGIISAATRGETSIDEVPPQLPTFGPPLRKKDGVVASLICVS